MKCARCGKPLDKPAAFVGGLAIGPKCWLKMTGKKTYIPRIYLQTGIVENQGELFYEDEANQAGQTDGAG